MSLRLRSSKARTSIGASAVCFSMLRVTMKAATARIAIVIAVAPITTKDLFFLVLANSALKSY